MTAAAGVGFAPSRRHYTPARSEGPGYTGPDGLSKMPDYSESMTLRELIDLVAYLKSLTTGMDHAGHPTGRPMKMKGPGHDLHTLSTFPQLSTSAEIDGLARIRERTPQKQQASRPREKAARRIPRSHEAPTSPPRETAHLT